MTYQPINTDGCVAPLQFLPNPKAPEEQVPESHGDDTSWFGTSHGYQPITVSTNGQGDYAGVSPMSPNLGDILNSGPQ